MDFRWKAVVSLRKRDGDGCCWCGMLLRYPKGSERRRLAGKQDPDDVTIEHLLPTSLGGTDEENNLLLAHSACNSERGLALWVPLWYPPSHEEDTGSLGTLAAHFEGVKI